MAINQGPDQIDTVHRVMFTFIRIITSAEIKHVNRYMQVNVLFPIKVH
jgi:hypothetical protein